MEKREIVYPSTSLKILRKVKEIKNGNAHLSLLGKREGGFLEFVFMNIRIGNIDKLKILFTNSTCP